MSTTYLFEKKITFEELLDGRLEQHGVFEDTERFGTRVEIQKGESARNSKVLTDGMNYIGVYGDEYVKTIQRCGTNIAEYVLSVIAEVFDADYFSEYQPQFWGFESLEEQDLAEMRGVEIRRARRYEEIMKFVRCEPVDFELDSDIVNDAKIARDLIAEKPSLAEPKCRDELLNAIPFKRPKRWIKVPDGPDSDVLSRILNRNFDRENHHILE